MRGLAEYKRATYFYYVDESDTETAAAGWVSGRRHTAA